MSLPQFPDCDPSLTREDAINLILSSIAMEELGLSHIINAEGEKLQYALGTIEGNAGPENPVTVQDLLELNKSVQETLNSTMMNQFFLKEKLKSALSAAVMYGPTGPTGPAGAVGPQGPSFSTVRGTFTGLSDVDGIEREGSGNKDSGNIVEVNYAHQDNTPGAFNVRPEGDVEVNIPGIYLVTGKLLIADGSDPTYYVIQLNGMGIGGSSLKAAASQSGSEGELTITGTIRIEAGSIISNALISPGKTRFPASMEITADEDPLQIPISTLTLVKIEDL